MGAYHIKRFAILAVFIMTGIAKDACAGRSDHLIANDYFPKNVSCSMGALKWRVTGRALDDAKGPSQRLRGLFKDKGIKTLAQYALWLKSNITYRKDIYSDVWLSPDELLNRKYGDCEDMAFLSDAALRIMGYRPYVIAFKRSGRRQWHAVCVFKSGDNYSYFDNNRLINTSEGAFDKAVGTLRPDGDIVVLNSQAAEEMSRSLLNTDGLARGVRVVRNNGVVSVVSE